MVRLYKELHKNNVEMHINIWGPGGDDYYDATVFFTFMKGDHVMKCPVAWDLLRIEPVISENILIKHLDTFVDSLK